MSPEQATGDRQLDARSDVYSLAAVLYEMLAGEPPVTGPTVQAIIAKLLTERPTRLRTVRDTVPEGIDNAVAKALAKVPADRYAGAADFAAALRMPGSAQAAAPRRRRLTAWAAIGGVVALVALGVWVASARLRGAGSVVALAGRTQLTFTGNVQYPALSPDGKQLAYFIRICRQGRCALSIDVQDVGGTTARSVLNGATAAYALDWSPDRRSLIAIATLGGRWGRYLISVEGGAPRFLTTGAAAFWAGGDSLLVGPPFHADSVFWLRVTSLAGAVADSIRVAGAGEALVDVVVVPGDRWIAAATVQGQHVLWQVMDRRGRVASRLVNTSPFAGASRDALWMAEGTSDITHAVVRHELRPGSGRLAAHGDTVLTGLATGFDVTADGSTLVYDDGTYDFGVWALDLAAALGGRFPDARRLVRSSSPAAALISPDGRRLLVSRSVAAASGGTETRLSAMAFDGGAETPLNVAGKLIGVMWADSVTAAVEGQVPGAARLALLDVRTGAERGSFTVPDSIILDYVPLRDGWAWIPASGDRIVIERAGRRREIPKPAWLENIFNINPDPTGTRIVFTGWNVSTFDTLGIYVAGVDGAGSTQWARMFAENGAGRFDADGSLQLIAFGTQESATLYRIPVPGKLVRLGTVPRPVTQLHTSLDLRRVSVVTRDYHGDAWMSKVVKR